MGRTKSWGFPRWGGYGSETSPEEVRGCDAAGCARPGEHPAPKSRYSNDKWWFCQHHAGEYNRAWNYFDGMSYEEIRRAAEDEASTPFASTAAWTWSAAESALTADERRALGTLGLEEDVSEDEIKARYRELAKRFHPDANPGDPEATIKFQAVSRAYRVLSGRESVRRERA